MNEEIYTINQRSESKELINFQICGITFPDRTYRIDRKASRISCIEYIEEGAGTVCIDGDTFYPKEGDSYFLRTGRDQHYFSDPDTPWKKYFINVSGKLLDSLAEGYGIEDTAYFEGLDLSIELKRIIELARGGAEDPTEELVVILNSIFFKMRRHVKSGTEKRTVEAEMKDFLGTQITQSFDLSLLCKHISRSESQTIRLFKKAYGITPYAYVLGKKIDLAKKLLENTNLTVKQISEKLCFSDEYYFSNLFKSKVGMSPASYRKSRS